jgi:phosphoglycolate phosphatase
LLPPRAILFDFDLTLADSTRAIVECFSHAFREMGLPCPASDAITRTIGYPLPKAFETLCGDADPLSSQVFVKLFIARADQVMNELTTMLPHASETARDLRARGIRTAIVSTKFRYRILEILALRGLDDAFDVVLGGEDVREHKPHPEGLRLALARLQIEPRDAWYVGDHPVDAQAAAGAGLSFVAMLTGVAGREDFLDLTVHHFLESMAALPALVHSSSTSSR